MNAFAVIGAICGLGGLLLGLTTLVRQLRSSTRKEDAQLKAATTDEWDRVLRAQGAWIVTLQSEVDHLKDDLVECEAGKILLARQLRDLERRFDDYVKERERTP